MRMKLKNFTKYTEKEIDFSNITKISGMNGAGKSSIATAYTWVLFDCDYNLKSSPAVRREVTGSPVMDSDVEVTLIFDLDGKEISSYGKKQLTDYRRYDIGFVFQFYNLVGNLTALENVELASQICSDPLDAGQVLADVGLADRASNFPAQLSGGEQQRVAIARALAKNPKLLLCDEPTGALDYNTGKAVLKLLQDTCRKKGVTVVVITHNQAITAMADRIITVKNGTVTDMRKNEHIVPVEQIEW